MNFPEEFRPRSVHVFPDAGHGSCALHGTRRRADLLPVRPHFASRVQGAEEVRGVALAVPHQGSISSSSSNVKIILKLLDHIFQVFLCYAKDQKHWLTFNKFAFKKSKSVRYWKITPNKKTYSFNHIYAKSQKNSQWLTRATCINKKVQF